MVAQPTLRELLREQSSVLDDQNSLCIRSWGETLIVYCCRCHLLRIPAVAEKGEEEIKYYLLIFGKNLCCKYIEQEKRFEYSQFIFLLICLLLSLMNLERMRERRTRLQGRKLAILYHRRVISPLCLRQFLFKILNIKIPNVYISDIYAYQIFQNTSVMFYLIEI